MNKALTAEKRTMTRGGAAATTITGKGSLRWTDGAMRIAVKQGPRGDEPPGAIQ